MLTVADLPLVSDGVTRERADAARNRAKILAAAERLIGERGLANVSMDDVAREACVGKGTLYRRFGDRASLALALLDEHERDLQESLLRGEPPLGPGAPARERLHAFGKAYLDVLDTHHALIAEAERVPRFAMAPYIAYRTHLLVLLRDAAPDCDADVAADALLAALAAGLFAHLRGEREIELERLKDVWCALVDGVLNVSGSSSR
jgi:AcrR family transcriptional regulator